MSTPEFAEQPAQAVAQDSAPVNPEVQPEIPAVNEPESATGEEVMADASEEAPKQPKVVKELIDQRKKRQKAEQEAAYWRGVAEARGTAGVEPAKPQVAQPVQAPATISPPTAPNIDDFTDYGEYERATAKYERDKEEYLLNVAEQRVFQKLTQQQQQRSQVEATTTFQQRLEKASETDPEIFDIVSDPTLPISQHMVPLIQASEMAPQLLRYLHSNRKEAEQVAAMPPLFAARELGRIEAQLKNTPKPTPPKRVSAAPEPIPTVTTNGATVDEDNLPIGEWIKRRNQAQFGR